MIGAPLRDLLPLQLLAVSLAVAPIVLALAAFRRIDALRPEPHGEIARTMLLGVAVCVPVFVIEAWLKRALGAHAAAGGRFLDAFLIAALTEESAKLAVVLGYAFRRQAFDEFTDGVLYTGAASLGFCLVENLIYLSDAFAMAFCVLPGSDDLCAPHPHANRADVVILGLVRAMTTVPMHALSAACMGYFIGRARFPELSLIESSLSDLSELLPDRIPLRARWILLGLLIAVLVHGTFDWVVYALGARPVVFLVLPATLLLALGLGHRLVRHGLVMDDALHGHRRSSIVRAFRVRSG